MSWTNENQNYLLNHLKKLVRLSLAECENFSPDSTAPNKPSFYDNFTHTAVSNHTHSHASYSNGNGNGNSNSNNASSAKKFEKKKKDYKETEEYIRLKAEKKERKEARKKLREDKKKEKAEKRLLKKQAQQYQPVIPGTNPAGDPMAVPVPMPDLIGQVTQEMTGLAIANAPDPAPGKVKSKKQLATCGQCGLQYKGQYL